MVHKYKGNFSSFAHNFCIHLCSSSSASFLINFENFKLSFPFLKFTGL